MFGADYFTGTNPNNDFRHSIVAIKRQTKDWRLDELIAMLRRLRMGGSQLARPMDTPFVFAVSYLSGRESRVNGQLSC